MATIGNAPVFPTESVLPGNLQVTGNATINGTTNSVGALTENGNNVVNVADTGVITEGMFNSDYYEEGTWTPALEGLAVNGLNGTVTTWTTQAGYYVKIGSLVFAYCTMITSAMSMYGDFSGFQINGLPFTSISTNNANVHTGSVNGSYDSLSSTMLDGSHAEVAGWQIYNTVIAITPTSGSTGLRYAEINQNGVHTFRGSFIYYTTA